MRTTISVSAVAIALAGCVTSDHEYGEAVRRHLAMGDPKEACCVGDNRANEARWEADRASRQWTLIAAAAPAR